MNTITLTEFAEQHRRDLLAEAAEYRRTKGSHRGGVARAARRLRHASRPAEACTVVAASR